MEGLSSGRVHRIAWVTVLALALGAARADAAPGGDQRELKAREDFAAGRYQQALDVFAKLYAETLHPTYLRNIGRCYQNLGDPDHAITSFRDYLRKHKTITADERTEVEGFIAEMEELQKKKAAGAPEPHPDHATAQSSTITPLPTAPEPKSSGTPDALVTKLSTPAAEESSVLSRWWFWTIVGAAAIGAGIGIAAATGTFTKTQDADCTTGYKCQ
jgi:hypothetical protein